MGIFRKSAFQVVALVIGASVATGGTTSYFLSRNASTVPLPVSGTSTASKVDNVFIRLPFAAKATATGSATVKTTGMDGKAGTKYAAICMRNPLFNVGYGSGGTTVGRNSGSILTLTYHNYKGQGVGGDIGFVRDCNLDGTGSTLLNDVCTATGCSSKFVISGNNGDWSGSHFLKLGLRANPGPGFEAFITGEVMDIIGE